MSGHAAYVLPDGSFTQEDATPRRSGDWWNERVKGYVSPRGGASTNWQQHTTRLLERWPKTFEEIGQPKPEGPTEVTGPMILAFKEHPRLARNTKQAMVSRLHRFLEWCKVPLANDEDTWEVSAGKATRRRWLTRTQVNALLDVATGRARLIVLLAAWQALRAIEISRLSWRDVNLDAVTPALTVRGKGKHGGEPATLAMNRLVWNELLPLSLASKPSDPVYPAAYGRIGKDLRALGRRAGIIVSAHDLRRAFGRIAYYDFHVPLVTIQQVYRHESVAMTAYYLGLDEEQVREGWAAFADGWGSPPNSPVAGTSTIGR